MTNNAFQMMTYLDIFKKKYPKRPTRCCKPCAIGPSCYDLLNENVVKVDLVHAKGAQDIFESGTQLQFPSIMVRINDY